MDNFILIITWFGSSYLLLPLTACICLLFIRAGRSREALLLGLSLTITIFSVHMVKLMMRRPRPTVTDLLLVPMPPDWSFPSAHTAQSAAFFLALCIIAIRILPPFLAGLVTLFNLLMIGLVGYSRIYLQVHFVSDVLAGLVLAILIVAAVQLVIPLLPWFQGKE